VAKLNLESNEPKPATKKNNRALKIGLGVGALVLVPVIGMTFAASITINSSSAIQFGQGVQQATACDSDVTLTAATSFANTSGAGSFNMGAVVVSGIADNCNAKKFTIKLFGDSSTSVLGSCVVNNLNGSGTATAVTDASNTACDSGTSGVTFHSTVSTNANTLTVEFGEASTPIAASGVYKATIETA